ncbi:ATP-binding cassette domain-containing protein [Streptomyces sp. NRRL S-118]|uniref:ATP-binding cassette domain-containing protein n=1 Tax=Streptomyces sp. NRRL S-118 TaxID=1463881 RepID=UPI003B635ADF
MHSTVAVGGLTVRHRRTTALDGLDLELGPGVHGLLGPNGAGKTSLIRVLATVAAPTGGRVRLLGRDIADRRERAEVRRRLGYLPQEFGYYPGFTVREFVAYVAWLKEMPAARAAAAVERAVERVGLADRIDARIRTLSGGMVRRVGIAQAIVNEPELLLLDEPTAGLDPEQRVEFRALLRDVGTASTVIVSTHLVEDVAAACTEVTLIESGRLAFRGTTAELTAIGEDSLADDGDDTPPGGATEAPGASGGAGSPRAWGAPGGAASPAAPAAPDPSGASGDAGSPGAPAPPRRRPAPHGSAIERGYTIVLRAHRAAVAGGRR